MYSQYPDGFSSGVTIRNVPIQITNPGRTFWVGNNAALLVGEKGASNNNKGTFLEPYSTINYAVTQAVAGRGDVIFVRPGVVETVTASGGLAIGTNGVALVGLGTGDARPTVNFTTATTASVTVTGNNVTIVNFLFTGGIDALTTPITVSGTDFSLLNSEFRDVTGKATKAIVATAGATRLWIEKYFHNGSASAGAASAIQLTGITNPVIKDFKLVGNFSVAAINITTTACVDVSFSDGYIWNKNSADVGICDTITGSTGKIGPSIYIMMTDNAANITEAVTGATFHLFDDVVACNLAGEKGMLINWVASTDA